MNKIIKSIILSVLACCFILIGGLLFHFNGEEAFYSMVKHEYVIEQTYSVLGLIMGSIGIQYIIITLTKEINGDLSKAYRNIGNIYLFFCVMSAVLRPSQLPIPTWQKFVMVFNISGYVMVLLSGFYVLIVLIYFIVVKGKTFNKNKMV